MKAKLTPEQRARSKVGTTASVAYYSALRDVRKAAGLTQAAHAKALGIGTSGVAEMERRPGLTVGALRRYVRALGGELRLMVELPRCPPTELKWRGDVTPEGVLRRETAGP